ncbi:hypothetical protein CH063_04886 [Colletotrichum higginsianum]|uniref:PD-(D/E)XK nuclease-like domain-containing protein n=1 Tax=Colletotrichum higginsianum (strain IMI 349063) TaxID=759273 RepID=H1UX09_COLHI|nr:hypothetical protein CH63R_14415 [Colletotrichum higginsianum IMI 349063]OBR02114.1 hypothetical protein CH63R_14415 [Colletotrichum higginsianum IMI 349063]CCF32510.1 hypothetical protein CH063_04886 [Colletotrichum higginsianum]
MSKSECIWKWLGATTDDNLIDPNTNPASADVVFVPALVPSNRDHDPKHPRRGLKRPASKETIAVPDLDFSISHNTRKESNRTILTPPVSTTDRDLPPLRPAVVMSQEGTPRKRPRPLPDSDHTPRASSSVSNPPLAPQDSVSRTGSTSATGSSASGRSSRSPTKLLNALELKEPLQIEFKFFSDADVSESIHLPPALAEVRDTIYDFYKDRRIIPLSHKVRCPHPVPSITCHIGRDNSPILPLPSLTLCLLFLPTQTEAATIRGPEARDISSLTLFEDTSEPQRYGPIPPVRSLRAAVRNSSKFASQRASEPMWNTEVHAHLLRLALRPDLEDVDNGLVNFTVATTARTHHLLHNGGPSKMIDFAMYIDTEVVQDMHLSQRIKELRQKFPSNAVNSTPYHFLRNKPISVTIETKRSDGLEQAVLQIGIWQAAHWAYLDRIASKKGATLDGLEFLPGLVVSGADWYFVASTREGQRTACPPSPTLWEKQPIGSTQSLVGTYKVIRTIQYLAWWSAEVYWPWFMSTILS